MYDSLLLSRAHIIQQLLYVSKGEKGDCRVSRYMPLSIPSFLLGMIVKKGISVVIARPSNKCCMYRELSSDIHGNSLMHENTVSSLGSVTDCGRAGLTHVLSGPGSLSGPFNTCGPS